jgi:hypothetical protein
LIVEESGIPVSRDLAIELVPRGREVPVISAIEVLRAGEEEVRNNVAVR